MNVEELKSFLYALCTLEIECDILGAGVRVQYDGDDATYAEWIPARARIQEEGLLDPGFGSGPILYEKLDLVEVRAGDWAGEYGEKGRRAFLQLMSLFPVQSS